MSGNTSQNFQTKLNSMRKDNEGSEEGCNILNLEWIASIKQNLEQGRHNAGSLSPECCIYRLPPKLKKELDYSDLDPQIVSLGPYHHGKARYSKMERQKWRIFQHVLDRNSQDVVIYLVALKQLEERVRKCYEEPIDLNTNQFVEMMILDGIFLLEFLRTAVGRSRLMEFGYCSDDPIFSNRSTVKTIVEDILKLENQLPLFLLDALLKLGNPESKEGEVAKLIIPMFQNLAPIDWSSRDYQTAIYSSLDKDYFHCLDIFLKGLLKASLAPKRDGRSAVICFKEKKAGATKRVFSGGVCQIRKLDVSRATKFLLYNFIAYKECHWSRRTIIYPYGNLIDKLSGSKNLIQKMLSARQSKFFCMSGNSSQNFQNKFSSTDRIARTMRNDNESCEERRNLLNPEWIAFIKQNLDQGRQDAASLPAKSFCIYRLPPTLKVESEYRDRDLDLEPQIVSLGPYHHGKTRYSEMEHQKWRILQHVLNRNNQDIMIYLVALKQLEERVRKCYEGTLYLTTNQFTEMMIVDGIFLLEFLQIASGQSGLIELGYYPHDPIFSDRNKISTITQDILKLENQLPLFLLDTLLKLGNPGLKGEAAKLILPVIQNLMPIDWLFHVDRTAIYPSLNEDYLHCLDMLLRGLLKASMVKVDGTLNPTDRIKFKDKKKCKSVEIKFHNAIYEVHRVSVSKETKLLLYNLIAYEECHPTCWSKIMSRAIPIDKVNPEQDATFHHNRGINALWIRSSKNIIQKMLSSRLSERFTVHEVFVTRSSYDKEDKKDKSKKGEQGDSSLKRWLLEK